MSGLNQKEISLIYKTGRKIQTENLIFFFLPFDKLKVAAVVSKKISKKAVVRNKIKRRIRHLSREVLRNGQYVIVVKKDISSVEFEKLKNEFKKVVFKVN